MPLTDTKIRLIKPKEKVFRVFDEKGLYLEISPKGGKWWRLKYRFNGLEKRISLGVYPSVTLKQARDRRDDARRLLGSGINPSEHRKNVKADSQSENANSFEVVAREWFTKKETSWAESHSKRVIRLLERDMFPWLGRSAISSVTSLEILSTLRRIEGRGVVETAHRALWITGQVFRYAVATGRADRNPAADLRGALPATVQKHFPAVTDTSRLAEILLALDGYKGSFVTRCALKIAPLVFVRPGELRSALWSDINLKDGLWSYTVSKSNAPHIVPLAWQTIVVLKELQPLTGSGLYVFPGAHNRSRPMSENTVNGALRRLDIQSTEMCGHGFRATARTILEEVLDYPYDLIEHQLALRVRDPLGRAYNRTTHLPKRVAMMQGWADYLDSIKVERESARTTV